MKLQWLILIKSFIDTEVLQCEILKLKNSIINSFVDKGTADVAVVKTDISNIKSSNEEIHKSIRNMMYKIADLYARTKELFDKDDKTAT